MNELWLQSPARPEVVCLCGSTWGSAVYDEEAEE